MDSGNIIGDNEKKIFTPLRVKVYKPYVKDKDEKDRHA